MALSLPKTWIERYQKGPHHKIPLANFSGITQKGKTLFDSRIQEEPIDLYVYNADTGDLVFGRANLKGGYPRELAHHIGIVRRYLNLQSGSAEKQFSQGSMDIAIGRSKKEVYFKYLTLGLEDMVFPEELEWLTHVGSLQDMAMVALQEIGMPVEYKKIVIKAKEWARIRTGLMQGREINYEDWKKRLKGQRQ